MELSTTKFTCQQCGTELPDANTYHPLDACYRTTELTHERDELRTENARLQRENGALARMYALSEEKLRERTGEVERLRAALTGVLAEADRKTDAFERAHAALER